MPLVNEKNGIRKKQHAHIRKIQMKISEQMLPTKKKKFGFSRTRFQITRKMAYFSTVEEYA